MDLYCEIKQWGLRIHYTATIFHLAEFSLNTHLHFNAWIAQHSSPLLLSSIYSVIALLCLWLHQLGTAIYLGRVIVLSWAWKTLLSWCSVFYRGKFLSSQQQYIQFMAIIGNLRDIKMQGKIQISILGIYNGYCD